MESSVRQGINSPLARRLLPTSPQNRPIRSSGPFYISCSKPPTFIPPPQTFGMSACQNGNLRCDQKAAFHALSRCNQNGSGGRRICQFGNDRCDIGKRHYRNQCNENYVPVDYSHVPVRTHDCIRGWYKYNNHSAHLRRQCSEQDDCPDPLPRCRTCAATPPYGPPSRCDRTWVQCNNGPPHQRKICTIDICQEKLPCLRCDAPYRQVFIMQRILGLPDILQPLANKVADFVGGSATHWIVMVVDVCLPSSLSLLNV